MTDTELLGVYREWCVVRRQIRAEEYLYTTEARFANSVRQIRLNELDTIIFTHDAEMDRRKKEQRKGIDRRGRRANDD